MKKVFILCLICCCYFSSRAQLVYYDALYLTKQADPDIGNKILLNKDVKQVLLHYYQNSTEDAIDTILLNKNPFFKDLFVPRATQGDKTRFNPLSISSLGGLDVTTFADGLAKFLIKRSKEELYVAFFENFHDKILKNYPEFAVLFPHTTELVDNFQSWEYANVISTLREAFDKDIKEILQNLPKILAIDASDNAKKKCDCTETARKRIAAIQKFFTTDPRGALISAAFFLGGEFVSGKKIPVIIDDIAGQVVSNIHLGNAEDKANLTNAINLLKIINNSIRNSDPGKSYVSIDDFTSLLSNEIGRKLFSGLLYQQIKNENIILNYRNLGDTIKKYTDKINGVIQYAKNILNTANEFSNAISTLNDARKEGKTDLSGYWPAVFESVKGIVTAVVNTGLIDDRFQLAETGLKIINAFSKAIEAAQDLSVRNYSAVVIDILGMIPQSEDTKDFKGFIVKYGSFAANVVEAKSSDEVEKAIEAVALPVGSSSIKKNTVWSIGLNGYLGGFYGNEYLSEKKEKKWRPISGVYAPIGIAISKGFGKSYGSLSLFISIIDLGAVASFRLVDDSTEKLPKLTLQNIFAPGVGLIYGVPKWPVSVGYSYQLGPMTREITADKVVSDKPNQRWQFFLAVDIPLINFYTKAKR